jgi:serine/threonine protein kinase
MEYVDGQPLRALVSRNGLSLDQFFSWFIPVADALCYAHEHGVMHRTLNIGHMVIARDGCPKILDFGLSPAITYDAHEENEKAASKPFIRINTIPEMPPHLSPEQ